MKLLPPVREWSFALLAGAVLLTTHVVAAPAEKPDVLVVICDQWNPHYVSWDNAQVRTPNLDGVAQEGLIFDRCYTNSPVCMPARVSLVTGWYPHNHGLWGNANQYHLPSAMAPMFRDIRQAGLTTAQIGKLHWFTGADWHQEFATMEDYHRAMGLDTVLSVSGPPDAEGGHDPYCEFLQKRGLLATVARDQLRRLRESEYEPRASVVAPEDYHDVFVTGMATEYIRQQPREKPLCLVVSLHSPHPPLDAPGKFATMFNPENLALPANVPAEFNYDRRKVTQADLRRMLADYLGKMALADDCIGRLIDAMKARGTWNRTLFVFTSDHGEMMGAHGTLSKGRFWEESARVPLVIRWPGHVQAGRTPALAQLFDVYPTIVEAIGGTVSPGRFARSLLPVATGQATSVRDVAVSEIGLTSPLGIMLRDPRYKWWADHDKEYLFDLDADPLEQNNLAASADHRETLQQMRERALTWLRSTQVNLAAGSKSKVQRVREAAEKEKPNENK
ncbi:MAG: sulfatase-like hydrolase/transferase [Chthoniobacter sp.]|uniref:sulfatase family protein n=1 Tax=Chthoniobacter sp. TaxID=2510640 RepID=UPI0032A49109